MCKATIENIFVIDAFKTEQMYIGMYDIQMCIL